MYKQAKDDDIIVILGDLAKQYHTVPLSLVNKRLHDFGFYSVSLNDLNKVKKDIDSKSDKSTLYQQVKSDSIRLEDYFNKDKDALPQNLTYTDSAGLEAEITLQDLDRFINIKEEYQKGYTGNVAWVKIKKRCAELGFSISNSPSFLKLIEWREAELAKTPSLVSHSDVYAKDVSRVFEKELGDLNLKKRDAQTHSNAFNKLKRELTDQYLFRQQLLEASSKAITVKPFEIKEYKFKPKSESLVAIVTDWHLGAKFDIKGNMYNLDIATSLVKEYCHKLRDLIILHKPNKVFIENLGDIIENVQMRKNQPYSIEFGLGEQIVHAEELQCQFIITLAAEFPNVKFEYSQIMGNHCRFSPSSKDALPYDSAAVVVRNAVRLATKEFKNVEVKDPDTEYRNHVVVNGSPIALVHGDKDKMNDDGVLSKRSQHDGVVYKALIGGHLHHLLIKENNGYIIMAGSLVGNTDFSDLMGVKAFRSQVVLVVDKEGRITPLPIELGNN